MQAEHLPALRSRLRAFAHQHLQPQHLKPLLAIDVQASFEQINWNLYQQIDTLHPCGIANPDPIFWTPNVQVLEQRSLGKERSHLKLTLRQLDSESIPLRAIAWNWGHYHPLPERVDIAYCLRDNHWNGHTTLELEVVGVRHSPQNPHQSFGPVAKPQKQIVTPGLLVPSVSLPTEQITKPILLCAEPPATQGPSQWFTLDSLNALLPRVEGVTLFYGAQRPQVSEQFTPGLIDYDRPRRPCKVLVLWTLPPSWTHLRWLVALATPQQIYVRSQIPDLPSVAELRSQLQAYLEKSPGQPLNLLQLGQQWWVAPCTLVAALRELDYAYPDFPQTYALDQELKRLQRWYQYSADQLSSLFV